MVDISSTCKKIWLSEGFHRSDGTKKLSQMSHSFRVRKSRFVLVLLVRSFINYIVSLHIFKKDNKYYVISFT